MMDGFESRKRQASPYEGELDALFASYREACGEPEAGADFMPRLWARIDQRRRGQDLFAWRRCARAFLGLAAALCLLLIVLQVMPRHALTPETQTSYLEQLSEDDRRAETFYTAVDYQPGAPHEYPPAGDGAR
jgi:hypothetical protein